LKREVRNKGTNLTIEERRQREGRTEAGKRQGGLQQGRKDGEGERDVQWQKTLNNFQHPLF